MKKKTVTWKWEGQSKKGKAIIEAAKDLKDFKEFLQYVATFLVSLVILLILWGLLMGVLNFVKGI